MMRALFDLPAMRAGLMIASAATLLAGCSTYRIRSAEDQGKLPVTKLETVKTTFALFWASEEHQFWLCEDKGDDLVCHRSCGGVQDVQCPTAVSTEGAFTTNTR